jgi:hypothetical protein
MERTLYKYLKYHLQLPAGINNGFSRFLLTRMQNDF